MINLENFEPSLTAILLRFFIKNDLEFLFQIQDRAKYFSAASQKYIKNKLAVVLTKDLLILGFLLVFKGQEKFYSSLMIFLTIIFIEKL